MCNCWLWFAAGVGTLCVGGIFLTILGWVTGSAHERAKIEKECDA